MTVKAPAALAEGWLYALIVAAPLAFGCVEPWSRGLLEIACFGLALLCLFRPERGHPSAWPEIAACVMLAVGALQRLTPIGPLDARPSRPFTVSLFATDEAMLLWAAYAALAWSVPRVLRDAAAARRFAWAVVASGALVAALGTAQTFLGATELYGLRYVGGGASPFGPYYNRDHAADLMALSLAVGSGILVSRMRLVSGSWRAVPPDWLRAQARVASALAVLGLGLALDPSRGALVGLAAGAGACAFGATRFIPAPGRRRRVHATLVAAVALGLAASYLSFAREVLAKGTIEESTAARLSLYASGLRMLRQAPVFGWGLGAVGCAFGAFQSSDVVGISDHVHSDWLELALQCGLAGMFLVGAAATAFGLRSARVWWAGRSREMRAFMGGGLAALATFAVHCLVDFCSQVPANAALAFSLAGWLGGMAGWADKQPAEPGAWPRWRWALAPVFLYLAALSARPVIGAWQAGRAAQAPLRFRAAILRQAIDWDPRPEYFYRLGADEFELALKDAAERPVLLRSALDDALRAIRLEPLNCDFLSLEADVLRKMGRQAESRALAARAQRLSFDPIVPRRQDSGRAEDLDTLGDLGLLPEGRP